MSEFERSPNVYGIETEYSILVGFVSDEDPSKDKYFELVGECHAPDAQDVIGLGANSSGSKMFAENDVSEILSKMGIYRTQREGMLSNGGRLYSDQSGLEYCTPETRTAEEAVLRCFDGDEIVLGLLEGLRRAEKITGYQVNRRIVDHNRQSRGIHLNTTTSKAINLEDDPYATEAVLTLNIVKGAIFGSGGLLIDVDGETDYHHSPRLSVTDDLVQESNYDIALIRYPFKKEQGGLARMETISGDALNFAWPLRASMVVTNALMGLLESRQAYGFPVVDFPITMAELVGRYGNKTLIAAHDKSKSAFKVEPLEIMAAICENILTADFRSGFLDDEEKQVLPEIIDVIDRMKIDESLVATQVESVARKIAIERRMDDGGHKLGSEKICRYDYYWDMLQGGVAERLRQTKGVGWQGFSERATEGSASRLITPPQDTRAKVRGEYIKRTSGKSYVGWRDNPQGNLEEFIPVIP